MKIKEINRAANIAWAPYHHEGINIALGTAAQLIDSTFSIESSLDIYDLNLSSDGLDLTMLGGVKSDYRFHKLIWGCIGMKSMEANSGRIVGGTHDGNILIYDPKKIINREEDSLLYQMKKHTGPVHCLDFNKFQDCLLASGSSESEIFVWDLNNPSSPTVPQIKSQPSDYVTSVAWNCQVQHILASTFPSHCAVWDLRRNEPIMKVTKDLQTLHWKMLSWHPEAATQLCLASENDLCPIIQLYDLRYASYPVHSLEAHERGVLTMAWCPQDPELLLSSGKDNKVLCWNPISESKKKLLFSTRCGSQSSFDLAWCPRNPSYIASSSCDGNVSFFYPNHNYQWDFIGEPEWMSSSFVELGNVEFSSFFPKQPKWMRRTAGATFAFGGRLISFSRDVHGCPTKFSVRINAVTCEPEVLEKAKELEHALNTGKLSAFCQNKSESCTDIEKKLQWKLLEVVLTGSAQEKAAFLLRLDNQDMHLKDSDNSENMYGVRGHLSNSAGGCPVKESAIIKTNIDRDSKLYRALLVGNIESAVDLCIQADPQRWADALVLANIGGQELLQRTQKAYFDAMDSSSPSKLISAIVSSDWLPFIENSQIESWKEILSAILIYSKPEEFSFLCEKLNSRLDAQKDFTKHNAALCYTISGNLERFAYLWVRDVQKGTYCLQDLIEQIIVLRHAIVQTSKISPCIQSGALSFLLNSFAAVLASQGYLKGAEMYLSYAKNEESCAMFIDRISQASKGNTQSIPHANFTTISYQQPTLVANPGVDMPTGIGSTFSSGDNFFFHHSLPINTSNTQQTYVPQIPVPSLSQSIPANNVASSTSYVPPISSSWSAPKTGFPHVHKYSQRGDSALFPSQVVPVSIVPSSVSYAPTMSDPWSENDVYQYPASVAHPVSSASGITGSWSPPKTGYIPQHSQRDTSGTSGLPHLQRYPKNLGMSEYPTLSKTSDGSQPFKNAYTTPYNVYHQPDSYNAPVSQPVNFFNTSQGGANAFAGAQASYANLPYSEAQASYTNLPYSEAQASYSNLPYSDSTFTQVSQSPSTLSESDIPSYKVPSSYRAIQTGWNDPPLLRETSAEHSSYQAPTPITTPLCGPIADSQATNPVTSIQSYIGTSTQQPMQHIEISKVVHKAVEATEEYVPEIEKLEIKEPIPPEHQVIYDVLEFLQKMCQEKANTPQIRRKLEEIPKRFENLYDLLRKKSISPTVVDGLHKIIYAVLYEKDFSKALRAHAEAVSNCNFGEICGFMPSIKVLLQVCIQLQICL